MKDKNWKGWVFWDATFGSEIFVTFLLLQKTLDVMISVTLALFPCSFSANQVVSLFWGSLLVNTFDHEFVAAFCVSRCNMFCLFWSWDQLPDFYP